MNSEIPNVSTLKRLPGKIELTAIRDCVLWKEFEKIVPELVYTASVER